MGREPEVIPEFPAFVLGCGPPRYSRITSSAGLWLSHARLYRRGLEPQPVTGICETVGIPYWDVITCRRNASHHY